MTIIVLARIDLAGAWTDTPPQAYEFGGLVSTLAIKICGKVSVCAVYYVIGTSLPEQQPVKATVKRIPE